MARLTAAQRRALPAKDFAVPSKRKLPIQTKGHAMMANAYVDETHGLTPEQRRTAKKKIAAALKRFKKKTTETKGSTMKKKTTKKAAPKKSTVKKHTVKRHTTAKKHAAKKPTTRKHTAKRKSTTKGKHTTIHVHM